MSLWETVTSWIYWSSKDPVYGPGRSAPQNLTPLSLRAEMEKTVVLGNVSYPKFVVLTQEELEGRIKSLRPTLINAERPSYKTEGVLGELEDLFLQGVTSRLKQVSPRSKSSPWKPQPDCDTPTQFLRRMAEEEESEEEGEW